MKEGSDKFIVLSLWFWVPHIVIAATEPQSFYLISLGPSAPNPDLLFGLIQKVNKKIKAL